jgi:2,3-dihydroxyphenylpropionate 1,2-dioxygenase
LLEESAIMTSILGGAMLPHAPQFFTLPDTEDKENVAQVRAVAARIGERLKALEPQVWVCLSNDHAFQFFQHAAPPFTVHVGGRAEGEFAGRRFSYRIAADLGFRVVRELYRTGFDPAFTSTAEVDYALGIPLSHMDVQREPAAPILPIFVNAYLPPQPPMERCYAFGRALAQVLERLQVRAVVVASGGMSHFPGTERYSHPNLAWDERTLEPLRSGNLRSLLAYDERELDDTGNIELRCWAVAAGALGERKPDLVQMNPSWHHNYASLGWWTPPGEAAFVPHYPPIAPHLVRLTDALHRIANDEAARRRYLADRGAFAREARVEGEQAEALVALDLKRLAALGVHPLVSFLANMHLERAGKPAQGS